MPRKKKKDVKATPSEVIVDAEGLSNIIIEHPDKTRARLEELSRTWLGPGPIVYGDIKEGLFGFSQPYANQIQLRPQLGELESQISKLKAEIDEKAHALLEQTHDAKQKEEQLKELEVKFQALSEKQSLSHLLTRVGSAAQQKLLDSPEFRSLFDRDAPCLAYVLSIDIRRSTELMLKAREPKLFAEFITTLASKLRNVVLESYGIFDKFTGDGILAFFPEFYSGSDAGYFALAAASSCHQVFAEHYEKNKHCFTSVLKEIGLGIGLDYGLVQIVQIGGEFTVVGTPVVYACRMGGAEAQHTYLNQPAFEQLFEKYSSVCDFDQCEIDIKHEGKTLAYSVELNGKGYSPTTPSWNSHGETATSTKSRPTAKEARHG